MCTDVHGYIKAFRRALLRCQDVDDAEAMYRFIRGLNLEAQRFVRLSNPATFTEAALVAER